MLVTGLLAAGEDEDDEGTEGPEDEEGDGEDAELIAYRGALIERIQETLIARTQSLLLETVRNELAARGVEVPTSPRRSSTATPKRAGKDTLSEFQRLFAVLEQHCRRHPEKAQPVGTPVQAALPATTPASKRRREDGATGAPPASDSKRSRIGGVPKMSLDDADVPEAVPASPAPRPSPGRRRANPATVPAAATDAAEAPAAPAAATAAPVASTPTRRSTRLVERKVV